MRIGIISDTHDNLWRLDEAIPLLADVQALIHCGDLISPFMVHRLGKGLPEIPVHMVWGNNDGDKRMVAQVAEGYPGFTIYGEFAEVEIANLRIAINHYPEIARGLAKSGAYDLVCYGHNHTAHQETVGGTLLLNPGEVMGLKGSASVAIFDTQSREVEMVTFWS